MRKLKMMSSILMAIVMMGALYSCNDQVEGTDPVIDDSDLIAAIESAEKQVVSTNALPNSASSVLESEFVESFVSNVLLAPELGYEVNLRLAEGADVGDASVAFFDLNGRELVAEQGILNGIRDRKGRRLGRRAKALRNCFDFVFPFSMTLPDNSVVELNSKEDWSLIREFYQANPDAEGRPQFVFPIQVVFGEETLTINSQEEFQEAKSACEVDRRRGRCFEIEFPITFTMPDQSQITLDSREDWVLIDEWYEANPDADERPDLVFPINITYRNDSTIAINSQEELIEARAVCETDRRRSACFGLVFPVTFVMPDDSQIVVESREDWIEVKAWYRVNPDADERPSLVFPVDIEFEDGTILTVNSEEELRAAKADCG